MYWADWGNHPKIETAGMDGTMRETLVEHIIQWPTGKHLSLSLAHLLQPGMVCPGLGGTLTSGTLTRVYH